MAGAVGSSRPHHSVIRKNPTARLIRPVIACARNPFGVTPMRALLLALTLVLSTPAIADETTGKILAFDRVANVIVLDDKTIWPLADTTEISPDLVAGDMVKIDYVGGGDAGVASITSILRVEG